MQVTDARWRCKQPVVTVPSPPCRRTRPIHYQGYRYARLGRVVPRYCKCSSILCTVLTAPLDAKSSSDEWRQNSLRERPAAALLSRRDVVIFLLRPSRRPTGPPVGGSSAAPRALMSRSRAGVPGPFRVPAVKEPTAVLPRSDDRPAAADRDLLEGCCD